MTVIDSMTKSDSGTDKVDLAYIIEGTQKNPRHMLIIINTPCCPVLFLLIQTRPTCLGMAPPTVGRACLYEWTCS